MAIKAGPTPHYLSGMMHSYLSFFSSALTARRGHHPSSMAIIVPSPFDLLDWSRSHQPQSAPGHAVSPSFPEKVFMVYLAVDSPRSLSQREESTQRR